MERKGADRLDSFGRPETVNGIGLTILSAVASFRCTDLGRITSRKGAPMIDMAKHRLEHGDEFPYDAPDLWWGSDKAAPPPPKDWAHRAARGILADLGDRHTIKQGFREIDEEVRAELVESLADIIRAAAPSN
jgi:hypothetical protein